MCSQQNVLDTYDFKSEGSFVFFNVEGLLSSTYKDW